MYNTSCFRQRISHWVWLLATMLNITVIGKLIKIPTTEAMYCSKHVVVVQLLSHVQFSATPCTHHARLPFPSLSPGVSSNPCPLTQWCHPTVTSCVAPISSCPEYFSASRSFPIRQLFPSGGQSIGASASVLPVNIQDWFPLGLIGFYLLAFQETLKSLLQHHSSKASVFFAIAFLPRSKRLLISWLQSPSAVIFGV